MPAIEVRQVEALDHAVRATISLHRLWGNVAIGLILTQAFLTQAEISADRLAKQLVGMSIDTARRRLHRLADIGRADCRRVGRRLLYRANAVSAGRTVAVLDETTQRRSKLLLD